MRSAHRLVLEVPRPLGRALTTREVYQAPRHRENGQRLPAAWNQCRSLEIVTVKSLVKVERMCVNIETNRGQLNIIESGQVKSERMESNGTELNSMGSNWNRMESTPKEYRTYSRI